MPRYHTHVLKDVGAQQKGKVIAIRRKGRGERRACCGIGSGSEGWADVHLWAGDLQEPFALHYTQ